MPGWDKTYNELVADLQHAFKQELPGMDAQYKLVPPSRAKPNLELIESRSPKKAGVLALFYPVNNVPHVVLMKRNTYPGVHSGQISFPGGKVEDQDKNWVDTALRETEEEIGVPRQHISVLGQITRVYIPPSNFLVQPVIGVANKRPHFIPHQHEVDELLEIPFSQFCNHNNRRTTKVEARGFTMTVPAYHIGKNIVWGATAMMISEVTQMLAQG